MDVNKKKILIVDDEADYCTLLKAYFVRKKYEVKTCGSLNALSSSLDTYKPDIILLDNNLPDGSGWSMAHQIAQNHPAMKLYLISAYTGPKNFTGNYENIEIWEKPISIDLLEKVF